MRARPIRGKRDVVNLVVEKVKDKDKDKDKGKGKGKSKEGYEDEPGKSSIDLMKDNSESRVDRAPVEHAEQPDSAHNRSVSRAEAGKKTQPVFEMVVLGSGGGPLETDCSGYLLKPYSSKWEDGIFALEGGSGLGALTNLLTYRDEKTMFPTLSFPSEYNTPVLKAAYVFSYLTCYLITHAHLDHSLSLIVLSGSAPPRAPMSIADRPGAPPSPPATNHDTPSKSLSDSHDHDHDHSSTRHPGAPLLQADPSPPAPRIPVYGTLETLQRLAVAFGGGIWPELGAWQEEKGDVRVLGGIDVSERETKEAGARVKRRKIVNRSEKSTGTPDEIHGKLGEQGSGTGTGVVFAPMTPSKAYSPIHPTLPITTLTYPVAHGCTSHGLYESSAVFIRYDQGSLETAVGEDGEASLDRSSHPQSQHKSQVNTADAPLDSYTPPGSREFLFFGDVESDYRASGDEEAHKATRSDAGRMNGEIWDEAARSWNSGRLAGIFIECSYDSSRPAHLMFGHISPPSLYHELKSLASRVERHPDGNSSDQRPKALDGLRIFITHVKESLVPHPSGKSARQRIMAELRALEDQGGLGVVFVEVKQGDRICEWLSS